jgi:DHA2 family multidrug resistance protein
MPLDGSSPATTAEPSRTAPNRWLVTAAVSFGTLMGAVDSSIVNVALPHMRGSLGATVEEIAWVATGYVLATVVVMPMTAFLGALFGQRQLYLAAFVLFLVGSAFCGTARTLSVMIVWRAVQGLGAGALQPTTQAILRQTFPPREQAMAMAIYAMGVMIGPAVGPTIGGWIVDNSTWPWIFYINLPVGAVGLFLVFRYVHEPPDIRAANRIRAEKQRKNLDWPGIALLSIGLVLLQYVLEEGQRDDWFESRTITACAIVAGASLVLLVVRELTAEVPVVNLRLFRDEVFTVGTIIGGATNAMLLASMFLLPVFMQELLGFTGTQAGLALIPRVIAMMVLSPIVGKLYDRLPARLLVGVGAVLLFLGSWQMRVFTLATSAADVGFALVLQGAGFAFLFVPLTTVAIAGVPRPLLTDATGLNSLFRQIGGSIGIAVFTTLLTRYGVQTRAAVAAHVDIARPEVFQRLETMRHGLVARGYDPAAAREGALRILNGMVDQQSAVLTFERLFQLAALTFLAVLPALVLLRPAKKGGPKAEVHAD